MSYPRVRRTRWRAIIATVTLAPALSVLPAAAGPPPNPEASPPRPALDPAPWIRLDTPAFVLFGQVPEERLRGVAARLDAYRAALEGLHPGARSSPRETSVYVFKSAAVGLPYTAPLADSGHHLGVNPPYDVPNYVTVAAPVSDPPLDILYHAYAHQFLDDNFPRMPLTVTEGLAEVYSGFSITAQGTLIGVPNGDHVRWLKEHAPLSLSQQFSIDARAPLLGSTPGRATFMAGSWALMHYLISGSGENRSKSPAFLGALQRGASPEAAALSAYGWSLERLQQEVVDYVQRNRFLPILVRREEQAQAVRPEARPMERDEVYAVLGELLSHAGSAQAGAAEAYFREALRLNPARARAYAGLGYLSYAQDRFTDAIPLMEKALEIEPDAMTCYLLARSLLMTNTAPAVTQVTDGVASSTPPWLARSRTLLARAIQMRPGFAAPYVTLGATHIYPDGDVAAGIELLDKARAMLPARMDIAGNLVYLLLRKGDLARAQALVDTVIANGGDPETLQSTRQALATYREHLEAKKSLAAGLPTAEEKAAEAKRRALLVKQLRAALAETDDPKTRERIEAQIRLEEGESARPFAEIYNEAVDLANQRDYTRAIALLESLLPNTGDPEMTEQIKKLLERFRQDAARLQQPVK